MTDRHYPSLAELNALTAENLERQRRFNAMHERRHKREVKRREEQRRELNELPAYITEGAPRHA